MSSVQSCSRASTLNTCVFGHICCSGLWHWLSDSAEMMPSQKRGYVPSYVGGYSDQAATRRRTDYTLSDGKGWTEVKPGGNSGKYLHASTSRGSLRTSPPQPSPPANNAQDSYGQPADVAWQEARPAYNAWHEDRASGDGWLNVGSATEKLSALCKHVPQSP